MIKDGQVRKLRQMLARGQTLTVAARRTGMDEKTARKYRDCGAMPSQQANQRTWRTRQDPFEDVWPAVQEQLEREPTLKAITLFQWLQDNYTGRYPDSQRRTFERRVNQWRAVHGPGKEVMFPQHHRPGDLAASDFTSMNGLNITIDGRPFEHMLYHFVLTYSNWESVSICFSESFESLSLGLQAALWKLGGVPHRHRSDSLSAAVNNLSEDREFRSRYRDLLEHYRMQPQRINVRKAHENGDVESSHGHLKTVVDQALLLRGSRDFTSREEYEAFLDGLLEKRNRSRQDRVQQEQLVLQELPLNALDHRQQENGIKVSRNSTIQVKRNTYSVHSRLIGHRVNVLIDAESISVFSGDTMVQQMPRLAGSGKHAINYRHVIDSLVRKPGAFEQYKYHEDMFPSSHFRMAYDWLCDNHRPKVGARKYLEILQIAARDSEELVQDALRILIAEGKPVVVDEIRQAVKRQLQAPPVTDVDVEQPDLHEFDSLLNDPDMEVTSHEQDDKHEEDKHDDQSGDISQTEQRAECQDDGGTDGAVARVAPAGVSRPLSGACGSSVGGVAQPHRVPCGVNGTGVPDTTRESNCKADESIASTVLQDLEQLRLETPATSGCTSNGKSAQRIISGKAREPLGIWQTWFGEESQSVCAWGATGTSRVFSVVHDMQLTCAAVAGC